MGASRQNITVENIGRQRLEDYLCDRFPSLSKMYLREVVKKGDCEVNGRHENIGFRLRPDDFIEIEIDLTREHSMKPQEIPIEIVHEDEDLMVVNKPAGMLVHPSHREKTGTLLNALSFHLNRNGGPLIRPGLIHRLDKDTSGLIVVAKNARAHRILCSHFQRKLVEKRYLALVDGVVAESKGTICMAIGRDAIRKQWGLKSDGKHAETRFQVRRGFDGQTLLDLEPVTGRTNQLRIHCAAIGHPIVGDKERGGSEFGRLCLHADQLSFHHPSSGKFIRMKCSPPDFIEESSLTDR